MTLLMPLQMGISSPLPGPSNSFFLLFCRFHFFSFTANAECSKDLQNAGYTYACMTHTLLNFDQQFVVNQFDRRTWSSCRNIFWQEGQSNKSCCVGRWEWPSFCSRMWALLFYFGFVLHCLLFWRDFVVFVKKILLDTLGSASVLSISPTPSSDPISEDTSGSSGGMSVGVAFVILAVISLVLFGGYIAFKHNQQKRRVSLSMMSVFKATPLDVVWLFLANPDSGPSWNEYHAVMKRQQLVTKDLWQICDNNNRFVINLFWVSVPAGNWKFRREASLKGTYSMLDCRKVEREREEKANKF